MDKVTDVEVGARGVSCVVSCKPRNVVTAALAGVEILDGGGGVAGARYSMVEGVEDGKAALVENDGDDAVKMAFVSGWVPSVENDIKHERCGYR